LFCCLRRPDVILFVLLPVRILDGDGSPLPDRLNDSRFDECTALSAVVENQLRPPKRQSSTESWHPPLPFSDNGEMADDDPFHKVVRPDEVFETPLFRMERSGRFIKIETHRTPEQQAALVNSVVENRHKLVERATECRAELKALIRRFSSLDILAHQIAQDMLFI
jgi:hypothetical protein